MKEEKKLSEELRHCFESDNCYDCSYYESDTMTTCRSLLKKAYEAVKEYEEMEEMKDGKINKT